MGAVSASQAALGQPLLAITTPAQLAASTAKFCIQAVLAGGTSGDYGAAQLVTLDVPLGTSTAAQLQYTVSSSSPPFATRVQFKVAATASDCAAAGPYSGLSAAHTIGEPAGTAGGRGPASRCAPCPAPLGTSAACPT